jgi:protein-tyrosine phosphatase
LDALCELEDRYHAEVHRWEPIRDAAPVPTLEWLRRQVDFIDGERRAGHSVFVHCLNGVSRSGMVMVAYLMWRDGLSRDRALEIVQTKRPMVRPNLAFMELLLEWEKSLKGRVGG